MSKQNAAKSPTKNTKLTQSYKNNLHHVGGYDVWRECSIKAILRVFWKFNFSQM